MALKKFAFNVFKKDKFARCGLIETHRGNIQTSAFMPVGTQATVKACTIDDIKKTGSEIILSNTYHLMIRPGVERIKDLANSGKYDNVVFHRVIDGFMAQTGDVKFGNSSSSDFNLRMAGMGGSDLPDLKQEFNNLPHDRGTLSMARSQDPNSANSQFFICFKPAPFLDNQYTVFGKVIEGMEFVDKIKRGDENNNGAVTDPDKIISFKSL